MESKKRKLPARAAARVEAVSKKRTPSLPPEQPLPPPVVQYVEEALPKSIVAGKPLPTMEEPQPADLPAEQYQSVFESGVMADSLERSRKKWLSEGIFEKYWTKPTKKKGAPAEDPKNPPKDSMTKLGPCTITIEPHVFDAVMYAVKDTTPRTPMPQHPQQPIYRPIMQYGPPNGVMPPPPPPPTPPPQAPKQAAPPRLPNPLAKTAHSPASPFPTPATNTQVPSVASSSSHQSTQPPPAPMASSPAPPTKSSDPVIQMLAERAATDQDLKALMRIVADGKASTDELKRFQGHIDELTKLLQSRQPPPQAAAPPQPLLQQPPPQPYTPTPPQPAPIARQPPLPPTPPPARPPQSTPPTHVRLEYQPQPQPQALRSKGPPPPGKPDISAVVFEFAGGSGDRFMFPKFSILEYLPGGPVIASFLIVRKGSSAESKAYDPQLDYYQPVTIRLYSHQGRQLDALSKVVAPPDEVRRYMDDIMDNATRAEYVLLAMRLPREKELPPVPTSDFIMQDASPGQVLWTASANGTVPQQKPYKQPPSEEQQYHNFISSVS